MDGSKVIKRVRVSDHNFTTFARPSRRWDLPWSGLLDQLPVADGVVTNGQLQDAKEYQAAAAGSASVEPEYELVEVAIQVRDVHRTLVRG